MTAAPVQNSHHDTASDAPKQGQITAVSAAPEQSQITATPEFIFFGNGPLADFALPVLAQSATLLFHARTREDLATAAALKAAHPAAFGILASFGVLIKPDFLTLFEPEGIINLHPSLLPKYRGASPIESAILAGDRDFSYSIMKLAPAMDSGPIYHQATIKNLPLDKTAIYQALATEGAKWIGQHFSALRSLTPRPQDDHAATFTAKFDKSLSFLQPQSAPADVIFRQIVAYQGFPKPKYDFFGKTCIILAAHLADADTAHATSADVGTTSTTDNTGNTGTSVDSGADPSTALAITCADGRNVIIDRLQPEGKRPMDARSFLNGYAPKP